jgi:uncharacterized protein YndB with AHSA1/START domain
MLREIKHQWFFPHPPEIVWEFLTNSELLSQWLMKNNFQPIVGHEFTFTTKSKINPAFDGTIFCKVLEVTPHKRLSYSWKGGPGKGKITLDSVVTWTLTPQDNGTELHLEHKGFKGMRNLLAYLIMNKGWILIVRKRLTNQLKAHKK